MIHDTIARIEEQLRNASNISEERRAELAELLARLKAEVAELAKTHGEQAQSIAGFTQMSAHEATRRQPNPEALQHSLGGLTASVSEFEKSHPRLVQVVNSICNTLSNLGI
jgi:anti-sigma factor RsiW